MSDTNDTMNPVSNRTRNPHTPQPKGTPMIRFNAKHTLTLAAALALTSGLAATASAAIPYSQGFENNTDGWDGSGGITRVASGSGSLGVSSSSGSYHAEIQEGGSSDGGYTFLGGASSTYPGNAFTQSLDLYVDKGWTDPTSGGDGFKLNMYPSDTSGDSLAHAGEQFIFSFTGSGDVNVEANGNKGNGTSITDLTSSGWYTFEATFRKTGNGTGPVATDLSVYDSAGNLLGTQTRGSAIEGDNDSATLGGNGYTWVSDWQDGFADDTLAIDNAQTRVVPEPATLALLGLGVGGLLVRRPGRRKQA